MHLPDAEYRQNDSVDTRYDIYDRYPAYELDGRDIADDLESGFETRISGPHKEQHEQMVYAGPYEQGNRRVI